MHGQNTIWSIDTDAWWIQYRELMQDSRFRAIESYGYYDYVAVLSPEEAIGLFENSKKDYIENSGIKFSEWQTNNTESEFKYLTEKINSTLETQWVLIEIYEWESGAG